MAKYIMLDGVNDGITVPAFMWDSVELDLLSTVANFKTVFGLDNSSLIQITSKPKCTYTTASFSTVTVDGMTVANNTAFIPSGVRYKMVVTRSDATPRKAFISHYDNKAGYLAGNFYGATFYYNHPTNGRIVVAKYNPSTGTLLDQSGNGNHATLLDGTYIDFTDSSGGGNESPVGVSRSISLADVVAFGDAIRRDMVRNVLDGLAFTDGLIKGLKTGVADTVTFNDIANKGVLVGRSDVISGVDSYTKKVAAVRGDTLLTGDNANKAVRANKADGVGTADTLSRAGSRAEQRPLNDTLAVSDVISKNVTKAQSDVMAFTDGIQKRFTMVRIDAVGAGDTFTKGNTRNFSNTFNDGLIITDIMRKSITYNRADGVAFGEVSNEGTAQYKADIVTFGDSGVKALRKALFDGLNVTDTLKYSRGAVLVLRDGFNVTHGTYEGVARALVETVGMADGITKQFKVTVIDGFTLNDTLRAFNPLTPYMGDVLRADAHYTSVLELLLRMSTGRRADVVITTAKQFDVEF